MTRRHLIRKYQVLTNSDSATSPSSLETDVSGVDFITYEIETAALVNATLLVKVCNDTSYNSANEFALDFAATISLVGATDTHATITIQNRGFKWMKLAITNNAGSGVINAWISGNSVGA